MTIRTAGRPRMKARRMRGMTCTGFWTIEMMTSYNCQHGTFMLAEIYEQREEREAINRNNIPT